MIVLNFAINISKHAMHITTTFESNVLRDIKCIHCLAITIQTFDNKSKQRMCHVHYRHWHRSDVFFAGTPVLP